MLVSTNLITPNINLNKYLIHNTIAYFSWQNLKELSANLHE